MTIVETRQKAHEMIDQVTPEQVDKLIGILQVMMDEDDEELFAEDIASIKQGLKLGERTYTMEEVLADFGLTMAEFEAMCRQPDGETRALDR